MSSIEARSRLAFILDLSSAFNREGSQEYLLELVNQAYPDDDESRAVMVEALTRK